LAAVEKPVQSVAIRVANSPLFIWFLSALLLTVGGGYLTHSQQCSREALQIKEQYYRLTLEIYRRQQDIVSAVEEATTIQELRGRLNNLPFVYAELRYRTLRDLQRELRAITARFEVSEGLLQLRRMWFDAQQPVKPSDIARFSSISLGELSRDISDADLPSIKEFIRIAADNYKGAYVLANMTVLAPRCSITSMLQYLLTDAPRLLVARRAFENVDATWREIMDHY